MITNRKWTVYFIGVGAVVSLVLSLGSCDGFLPWRIAIAIFGIAFVCEYINSSVGMGFGTILTPCLMFFGFAPAEIVPTILLTELFTGIICSGSLQAYGVVNLRPGNPGFSALVVLSVCTIIGTVIGVCVSIHLPRSLLSLWIAVIVIAMGILVLFKRRASFSYLKLFGLGILASFNKGLCGGGFGPLLTGGQLVTGIEAKETVAITSYAKSFTGVVGLLTYYCMGKSALFPLTLPIMLAAICSVPLAVYTLKRVETKKFKPILAVAVILLGILLLLRLGWQ